jgi:hypothetical protein
MALSYITDKPYQYTALSTDGLTGISFNHGSRIFFTDTKASSIYDENTGWIPDPVYYSGNIAMTDGTVINTADIINSVYSVEEIKTITKAASELRDGNSFAAGYLFEGVADNAYAILLVTVGINPIYTAYSVTATGKAYYSVYTSPTITSVGTLVPIFTRNAYHPSTTTTTVHRSPTYTNIGTASVPRLLPGGNTAQTRVGGAFAEATAIQPPGATLMFAVQNKSGATADINIVVDWYKVPLI